jgi:hypothetical protein
MQIRVADSQSRTPGWVLVNAFAHVQLREADTHRLTEIGNGVLLVIAVKEVDGQHA